MHVSPRSRDWDEALDPPLEWLERANRQALVARLVAATVHDVSNALQVMSGAAEMLGLDPGPEAVIRRSGAIVDHAMSATGVLQQLTAFTRETARPAEPLRVRSLCERALLLRQYSLRKLRIAGCVEGDDGACVAPSRALFQVVLNLVVNAEEALAGRSDPALTLTVAAGAGRVTLVVADNGPGLSEAARDRAFRWPPAAAPESGTLGIGLLVSRALMGRIGGTLDVTSRPEGGTAVVVGLGAGG